MGRDGGWDGAGELREVKVCNSCREEWKGNHVVIRKMIVKKHSEPSCEMENVPLSWDHAACRDFRHQQLGSRKAEYVVLTPTLPSACALAGV